MPVEPTAPPHETDAPAATPGEAAAPVPPARRRGTLRDLRGSLAAIVALVVGLVLLVPRPQSVTQPPVDVAAAAARAGAALGFAVSAPQGLPQGWRATQAEVREGQGKGITTWRATFLTPTQGWASVVQASEYSPGWENREVSYGRATGTVDIDGVSWTRRDLAERSRLTLVHRAAGEPVTTIVTCACPEAELRTLLTSLRPAPGR
ncbi:MAG: DUF4245 family protein [Kineosporiaceae bacterium]